MKTAYLFILALLLPFGLGAQQNSSKHKPADHFFTISDDGTKLFTKVSGKGDYCIYVHGGPGMWSRSFEDLKGKTLESKLKMVYYDQRGSGRSGAAATGDYSVAKMVDDIEAIRCKLGTEKVYLMAHSFGGIIATSYAKRYPEHLKGLILVNSTLYLNNSVESQVAYANSLTGSNIQIQDGQHMPALGEAMGKLSEKNLLYKLLTDSGESFEALNKIDAERPEENGFRNNVWSIGEYYGDFTKPTSEIKVPVLVISGKKDWAVGPQHYKLFKFPHQTVSEIDGGHLLYFENNDEFRERVFSFIRSK